MKLFPQEHNPMKILEINKFNYVRGGAEKHFLDLVRLLKNKGHEVAVFSMEHPQNEFSPWKKYFVSYVGYDVSDSLWQKIKGTARIFYSIEARIKIKKLLDDFQPDIVHIHNIYHQISPSILTEIKKRKIPIIMTVHDYALICPDHLYQCNGFDCAKLGKDKYWEFIIKKGFKNSYVKSVLVVLEKMVHDFFQLYEKNIDLYICPSEFMRKKIVAAGIAAEKTTVIPHFFQPSAIRAVEDIEVGEKYIFHFGRLSKGKGVDRLIRVVKSIPNLKLYLAGKIEDDLVIPNDSRIKYLGFLNAEKILEYIKQSLFVVSFSKLSETFGLIALEANSSGKPFVGYRTGALSEIVENNRTGCLCSNEADIKMQIERLVRDDGLRILFSRNALKNAEKFNAENFYKKIMQVFLTAKIK